MAFHVWYVDDEPDICDNFSELFSSADFLVKTFTDPKKAIEEAKRSRPDLVFLDFRMKTMTGDEVALLMDPKIPKFLVTGDISIETKYKFDRVINKPYNEKAIFDVLGEYKTRVA